MKRTVYFPEIFDMVGEAETTGDKVAIIHKYYKEKGFIDIIKLCYEPKIKWLVTREEIENLKYDDMDIADFDLAPSTLFLEARRRMYNFTNVRQPPLSKEKVIKNIARMFSSLHHREVELFKQIVDGKIEELGLSEELIRKIFPNLLSGEYVAPEPEKKKRGRPPGAKNKPPEKKKRGRPPGAKNKPKKAAVKKPAVKKATTKKVVSDKSTATVIKAVDKQEEVS